MCSSGHSLVLDKDHAVIACSGAVMMIDDVVGEAALVGLAVGPYDSDADRVTVVSIGFTL